MNFSKKGIVVIVFLALVGTIAKAQNNDFSSTITLGIGAPILDGGIGGHIGFNPAYSVSEYFAVEGQLSYAYMRINSSFISGKTGKVQSANILTGGRVYFTGEDKKVRPYANLLIGGMYNHEVQDSSGFKTTEFGFGLSAGAFVNINQFILGLSLDTPQNIIFKLGYTF